MTAATWIALGSLAFVVVAQLVGVAFMLGSLFTRVKTLERELAKSSDCTAALAALNATMGGLLQRIGTLEETVREAVVGARPRAREARG